MRRDDSGYQKLASVHRLVQVISKETQKLCITDPLPSQRINSLESISLFSISCHHHVSSFPRTVDASSCCVLKRLIICLVSAVIVWGHWGHRWGLSSAWGHPELSRHRSQDRGSHQLEVLPLERGPYSCVVQSGPVVRSGPRAGGVCLLG